jgi:RHS repeat-associated protein
VASAATQDGQLYYIVPDHLNTPRLVADAAGTTVWRWDQQEPFGATPPNDNPSGLGAFDFPLRFPGQYFDRETGLAQNWFRDYDSTTARYIEADPLGMVPGPGSMLPSSKLAKGLRRMPAAQRIAGGLNHEYTYVANKPLVLIDPFGLYGTESCTYYEGRCQQVGGLYYCTIGRWVCKNWPDDPWGWSRCVRQCLQDFDQGYCPPPPNSCAGGGGSDVLCIINIHQMCWQECIGGGPPTTFP